MFQNPVIPATLAAVKRTKVKTTLMGIPSGAAGTRKTLRLMRGMITRAKRDFDFRRLALDIVRDLPPKNWKAEARAIQEWVKQNVRYVRDIQGIETLHSPQKILEYRQGDCDDQAMLVATLLESIGFSTRLHAIGFRPGSYSHVFADVQLAPGKNALPRWFSVETTEDWPLGKIPKNVVSHMMV